MLRFQVLEDFFFTTLMASLDVDQKFLGQFAKLTETLTDEDSLILSPMLYKLLGLSVLLSKKLIRARRFRKLDTTRDTKSLQLYHHIIWLSREGLAMLQDFILPRVGPFLELTVLAYKLRASFYHIFVLFHNQPSINQTAIPSFTPGKGKAVDRGSLRSSPTLEAQLESGAVRQPGPLPPGLTPISIPKPSASFLLPAIDYIPKASSCFTEAADLADRLLSGSHPLRLSVKVEYAAYLYDCLHDGEGSRKLAQQSIRDVYNAQEGMDDDMFEDAAVLVGLLGKMMKRGLSSSGTPGSTPGKGSAGTPSTPRAREAQVTDEGIPPAMPSPGMVNPI